MKPQERLSLISQIAYKLQEDMNLTGIKSYFFAFNINCNNFNASYNSKRVFVEEVLSSVENDIILKIGIDLKLINMQDLNIERLINHIYKICMEKTHIGKYGNYLPFYENIQPKTLAHLFAYFHFAFNSSFDFMNHKLYNRHFNADESRELIETIKYYKMLANVLKNYKYPYIIEERYQHAIEKSNKFLSKSGGSRISDDFQIIELIEIEPIFYIESSIKVKKYNFETKLIGEGSYAKVLKYKDEFYNKYFAIKKAKNNLEEKEVIRFKREFETMKILNSPYILEVYNFNEEDNSYVMEFADFTIGKYIEMNNTKLQNFQRVNIVNQIFKAFEYLHSKEILHRDISMSNLLLKQYENDLLVVKLADFGLVKLKDSQLTSEDTEFKGSLNDPNLEVKGGFKNFRIEHEIYALTRLIYFIMTGRKIIEKKFINKQFEDFILNGIHNDINIRYKNIREMRNKFNLIKFN